MSSSYIVKSKTKTISKKRAERKVSKGKGMITRAWGTKSEGTEEYTPYTRKQRRQHRRGEAVEFGTDRSTRLRKSRKVVNKSEEKLKRKVKRAVRKGGNKLRKKLGMKKQVWGAAKKQTGGFRNPGASWIEPGIASLDD